MTTQDTYRINPAAYQPLLELIAKGESNGNYNAYFSAPANTSVPLTAMTVAEVLQWQQSFVEQGNASNAAGRYQIIRPTLASLVEEMNLDETEVFDESLQDTMAITLMMRRGSVAFAQGSLSPEEFAHNLSKEWAALPQVIGDSPEASYYDGDGLNESRVESKAVLQAVEAFGAAAN